VPTRKSSSGTKWTFIPLRSGPVLEDVHLAAVLLGQANVGGRVHLQGRSLLHGRVEALSQEDQHVLNELDADLLTLHRLVAVVAPWFGEHAAYPVVHGDGAGNLVAGPQRGHQWSRARSRVPKKGRR